MHTQMHIRSLLNEELVRSIIRPNCRITVFIRGPTSLEAAKKTRQTISTTHATSESTGTDTPRVTRAKALHV